MKKIVLALSMMATALVLASCANQGTHMDQGPGGEVATVKTMPAHHDYKGETK